MSGGSPDPDILQRAFDANPTPNDKEREMLATASGYTYKQVRQHFTSRTEHPRTSVTYCSEGFVPCRRSQHG
jgi:hypothetical protein